MSVNLRGLIGKLNDETRKAVEAAAGLHRRPKARRAVVADEDRQVLAFVVRRNDDEDVHQTEQFFTCAG